jgi:hypothetical protein
VPTFAKENTSLPAFAMEITTETASAMEITTEPTFGIVILLNPPGFAKSNTSESAFEIKNMYFEARH